MRGVKGEKKDERDFSPSSLSSPLKKENPSQQPGFLP